MSRNFAWAELTPTPGGNWWYTPPALVALVCAIPAGLVHAIVA